MTFSVNQVNHLYVANTAVFADSTWTGDLVLGNTQPDTDNAGDLYIEMIDSDGNRVTRSDLVNKMQLISVRGITTKDLGFNLKKVTVTVNSAAAVTDSNDTVKVIPGQDYILRIAFRQFVGMSDEDQYFKFGAVHATANMTVSDFYKEMAISLAKNFSKEPAELLKFSVATESTPIPVTALTKVADISGTATGLIIEEVKQEWRLGVKEQVPVYFEVYAAPITVDGDEVLWATKEGEDIIYGAVSDNGANLILSGGRKLADLEYFLMGERGDQYRQINWPHNIVTEYKVDPTQEYAIINVHYYYVGGNEGPQKSEKEITIACLDPTAAITIFSAFDHGNTSYDYFESDNFKAFYA